MSKKSRRRNKKILAALALAGGAALAGRGRGEISSNRPSGIDAAMKAASSADTVAAAPISNNKFRTRHRITDSGGNTISPSPGLNAQIMQAKANAPKNINHPLLNPTRIRTHARGVGLRMKSGGRVTGAAKRGFGRALMKGKK